MARKRGFPLWGSHIKKKYLQIAILEQNTYLHQEQQRAHQVKIHFIISERYLLAAGLTDKVEDFSTKKYSDFAHASYVKLKINALDTKIISNIDFLIMVTAI